MPTSSPSLRSAERLFFGASWALSHGDAGGLAQVVADLAQGFTGELQKELRKELLELSMQCHVDYDGAVERWPAVCAHAHAVLGGAHPSEPASLAKGTTEMPVQSPLAAEPGAEAMEAAEATDAAGAAEGADAFDALLPRPTIIPVMPPARPTPSSEQVTQPITPPGRRRRIVIPPRRD